MARRCQPRIIITYIYDRLCNIGITTKPVLIIAGSRLTIFNYVPYKLREMYVVKSFTTE